MKQGINPPNLILIFIALQILLHYLLPILNVIPKPYNYLGILLIVLGQIPNFWIYSTFSKMKTTLDIKGKPKVLITSGFFKISRNPNYLGMLITLLGVAILLGSLVSFIFPLIFFVWTNFSTIPIEEKNLQAKFRKKYLNYKNKVRRWI